MEIDNRVIDKTEETGAGSQGSARSAGFGNVKNRIADNLHNAAETIGKKTDDQGAQAGIGQYGKQISGWFDRAAGYVRQFDYEQADAGVREYVRQSPGRSLLIAGGIGLMLGAVLRRR